MSPVNFSFFRSIPTKIKLNGPLLKIVDQPSNATPNSSNFVTFEVSTVAEYVQGGGNADGNYLFNWYLDGAQIKDVSESPSSNASIVNVGGTSTLTLTNIDPSFNGKEVYVEIDYQSAPKEGIVINSPLRSNTVIIDATGLLEITTQPEDFTGGSGLTAAFDVAARITPDTRTISYRWQMGGEDLVDGVINTPEEVQRYGIVGNSTGFFTVKEDGVSGSEFTIDWSEINSYSGFIPGKTYVINSNADITTKVVLQGGGGGQSGYRKVRGSSGGSISGNMTFLKDKTYYLQVGSAGEGGVKRYKSEVEHVFNSRTDQTISLDESNNITVTVMNPNQNDPTTPSGIRLPCNGDINARYYKIKFNTPFQDTSYQIKIVNLSSISAGGGPGLFTVDTIKNKTVDGFDVWFCKTNPNNGRTANSFIRSFTLNVFGMKVGEDENGEGGFPGGGSSVADENKQNKAAGGGGYTALFENSVSHSSAIIIAGGGGGSSSDPGVGGDGGFIQTTNGASGADGLISDSSSEFGRGATSSSGGAGGGQGGDGSALKGGDGFNTGAGGGGGYYGGGGGGRVGPGSGGGGSSYIDSGLILDMKTSVLSSNYGEDGKAIFELIDISTPLNPSIQVSGAFTPNLRLFTDTDNVGAIVNCNLTAQATNSPLLSNIVSYQVLSKQPIVSFEAIDTVENWIQTKTINFNKTNSFTLNSSTFGSQYKVIQFHSKETDFILTMDIKSSAGLSVGGNAGGEGGTSKIKINIKKDFEYTILGISDNSSVFIYEKSRLIAVVGQGGNAGQSGVGGDGGGANVDGRTGGGINPGVGGERPVSGTLTTNGVYGSILSGSNITLYSEDSISSVPNPGRTISCSKGLHYINSGFSPCEDIGDTQIQFVDQNGVTYSQSPLLNRGFKAGYTVTDTAGRASDTKSGNGGNGATGGQGGVAGAGGGGGSGYVDEEVIVVNTSSGGNSDVISSIVFSID